MSIGITKINRYLMLTNNKNKIKIKPFNYYNLHIILFASCSIIFLRENDEKVILKLNYKIVTEFFL